MFVGLGGVFAGGQVVIIHGSLGGGEVVSAPPDSEGLEYTFNGSRTHFTVPESRMHFTVPYTRQFGATDGA